MHIYLYFFQIEHSSFLIDRLKTCGASFCQKAVSLNGPEIFVGRWIIITRPQLKKKKKKKYQTSDWNEESSFLERNAKNAFKHYYLQLFIKCRSIPKKIIGKLRFYCW